VPAREPPSPRSRFSTHSRDAVRTFFSSPTSPPPLPVTRPRGKRRACASPVFPFFCGRFLQWSADVRRRSPLVRYNFSPPPVPGGGRRFEFLFPFWSKHRSPSEGPFFSAPVRWRTADRFEITRDRISHGVRFKRVNVFCLSSPSFRRGLFQDLNCSCVFFLFFSLPPGGRFSSLFSPPNTGLKLS